MSQADSSEIYIGIMSGTSLDGIDVAIVDFAVFPPSSLHSSTTPYPETLQQSLRELTQSQTTSLDALYSLDADLGELYAEAVNQALELASLDRSKIAALGCHGQTIRHRPDADPAYTAQLGDPNRIASRTGITTVADFRRKDIALGGQGAPLASAFHQFLFHSPQENRVLLNIGGIANITNLPANPDQPVIGFDTGPGNTLLDHWTQAHRNQAFDSAGEWARSGQIIENLLQQMLSDETYFKAKPPKSTGTEYFNPAWLAQYLEPDQAAEDVLATLVELSARTIAAAIGDLPTPIQSAFVCGGGAHNQFLLERLAHALPECSLQSTQALGIDPDYVEATAFAWLARERLRQRPGNLPEVTAAQQAAILGGIFAHD